MDRGGVGEGRKIIIRRRGRGKDAWGEKEKETKNRL